MKKRFCQNCGEDISYRPIHHYLCYECWLESKTISQSDSDLGFDFESKHSSYNPTYEERYKGDSEYDMGPYWDYDEYPPENL